MTHAPASDLSRATPLWRVTTVLYAVGVIDFVVAFAMIFVSYFLDSPIIDVIALYMFLGAWPVLFVAAVLDVLRHR